MLKPLFQRRDALEFKFTSVLDTKLDADVESSSSQITLLNDQIRILQEKISEIQQMPVRLLSLAAREATARLFRIWSVAVLFVTSAIAIVAGLWIIIDIVIDRKTFYEKLALTIAVTSVLSSVAALGLKSVAGSLFGGVVRLPDSEEFFYFFPNNILSYLNEHVMPGVEGLLTISTVWASAACLVLIAAVTACLWLPPEERALFTHDPDEGLSPSPLNGGGFDQQRERRDVAAGASHQRREAQERMAGEPTGANQEREGAQPVSRAEGDSTADGRQRDPYALSARRMLRSWQRLQVVIVAAALLLIVETNQVVALLQWPLSLLPQDTGVPSTELASAMQAAVAELGKGFGVGGTLLVAALLVPAALILWRRAWHLALTANGSAEDASSWLSRWNLSYSPWGLLYQPH